MKILLQDVRFGLRMLRKSPGFTAVAIITLALGVGANSAIFSLINAIMLRTLPVKDPASLVFVVWAAHRPAHAEQGEYMWGGCPATPATACSFSFPIFQQFHSQQQVFSGLFAYLPANVAVNAYGHSSYVLGLYTSGDFFSTLGTQPLLGRLLAPSDDSSAAAPAVVISSRFWQNVLGGDREAVGKSILIGKAQFTIVGIAPSIELDPGVPRDFWLPLSFQSSVQPDLPKTTARAIWLQLMARLKPGISNTQAASAMSTMFAAAATHGAEAIFAPSDEPRIELPTAAYGLASLRDSFSKPLFALFAAVALVLLIACANIAGIMLARSTARRKEMAVRNALGATRVRIMRQLLTESLLLSIAGGAAGVLSGYWGAESLAHFLMRNWYMPMQVDVHPDVRVLAFTALAALVVGLLFGVAPAFSSGQVDLVPALKQGSGSSVGATHGRHMTVGNALVVAQMALAVLVLAGAGLLVRTLVNLRAVKLGFDPQNLLVFGVDTTYAERASSDLRLFNRELQDRLATLPGVNSVSFSEVPLLSGGGIQGVLYAENSTQSLILVDYLPVAPKFFETMGIPLLTGRILTAQDSEQTSSHKTAYQPVVINENLAHRLFGNQNPVGRHFRQGTPSSPISEVVGVVGDAKYDALRVNVMPTLYAPIGNDRATFEVRTALDPKAMMPGIRAAVSRFDPNLLITTNTRFFISSSFRPGGLRLNSS